MTWAKNALHTRGGAAGPPPHTASTPPTPMDHGSARAVCLTMLYPSPNPTYWLHTNRPTARGSALRHRRIQGRQNSAAQPTPNTLDAQTMQPYAARLALAGSAGAGAATPAGRRGSADENAARGAAARWPGPEPAGNGRAPTAMPAAMPGGSAKPSALVARKSLAGPATGPWCIRMVSSACSSGLCVSIGVTCRHPDARHGLVAHHPQTGSAWKTLPVQFLSALSVGSACIPSKAMHERRDFDTALPLGHKSSRVRPQTLRCSITETGSTASRSSLSDTTRV